MFEIQNLEFHSHTTTCTTFAVSLRLSVCGQNIFPPRQIKSASKFWCHVQLSWHIHADLSCDIKRQRVCRLNQSFEIRSKRGRRKITIPDFFVLSIFCKEKVISRGSLVALTTMFTSHCHQDRISIVTRHLVTEP